MLYCQLKGVKSNEKVSWILNFGQINRIRMQSWEGAFKINKNKCPKLWGENPHAIRHPLGQLRLV